MSEKTKPKLDVHETFARWLADVRSDRSSRYLYGKRAEHLELLMQYFIEHGIDQDDAQSIKRKVVEALVTSEGMKGKDKHKGWKENAENDFDDSIQKTYVPAASVEIRALKTAQGYDPLIVAWAKKKYGDHVGEEIIKAAHQPLHLLYMMFVNEHFNRDTGGIL